ncbi:hypothetical protein MKW92_007298 [Papaver armeniacum]|nr:hypothetical protein MKW92_007298 [Papaver armeniacum]
MNNPVALPTLRHFTHPTHILRKEAPDKVVYKTDFFGCDACKTLGSGIRYHCKQCQFDLHEECATCPEDLTCSYLQHNKHQFSLVWEGSELIKGLLRPCDVCGEQVNGLFYKSTFGGSCLFLHPSCSNFPSQLNHVMDKRHLLTFQSFPVIQNSACTVCGDVVCASSWSYRCDPCGINIHIGCLLVPYLGASSSSKSPEDPHPSSHSYSYTSSSGGSKRKMCVVAGKIALRLIFTATFGVPT